MGLISFVKTAGRKVGLFGGRAAAEAEVAAEAAREAASTAAGEVQRNHALAADIRAAVLSYVDVSGLEVTFDGNTAVLMGTTTSQSDSEKAVLVAGNTEGVGQVDDRIDVEVPEPPAVYHMVVSGDTLAKIAGSYYGIMRMYDGIFQANTPMLKHPDEIYPGQVLRVPPVSAPTHTVASGETLGSIAKHWYGDAMRYTDIFEANRFVMSNPDSVSVGQQLTIPLINPKVA